MKAKGGKDMGRTGNIRMLPGKLIIFFCIFLSFLLAGGTIAEARVYTANCAPSFTSQPGNVVVMAGGNNAIVFGAKAQDRAGSTSSSAFDKYNDWSASLYKVVNGTKTYVSSYGDNGINYSYKTYAVNVSSSRTYYEQREVAYSPSKTWTTSMAGTYQVKLSNSKGDTWSSQFKITVVSPPEGTFSWNGLTWSYNVTSKTLSISGKGNMLSVGAKNYPWYDLITDYRQYGNSGLHLVEMIVIDDKITSIGNYAFANGTSLKRVMIGSGVTSIGTGAFQGCNKIESLCNGGIENQSIGTNAFNAVNSNTKVYHTRKNTNFWNAVSSKGVKRQLLSDSGYIEIYSATDWFNQINANGGVGRYKIMQDFAGTGNYTSSHIEVITQKPSRNGDYVEKSRTTSTKTFSRDISPFGYYTETVTRKDQNGIIDNTYNYTFAISNDFYGLLEGNGKTIKGVTKGLFNKNYGVIQNLNIQAKEDTSGFGIVDRWNRTQGLDDSDGPQGTIARTNNGTIDTIEVIGTFCGGREYYYDSSKKSYYTQTRGPFGIVVGTNNGTIRKTFTEANGYGTSMAGIAGVNNGTIYGCATEGKLENRANGSNCQTIEYNGNLAGITITNNGIVEQCYGGMTLSGAAVDYGTDRDRGGGSWGYAYASSLITTNNGNVINCSTGGKLQVKSIYAPRRDKHDNYDEPARGDAHFSKFIFQNNGYVKNGFIGAGFNYNSGKSNTNLMWYSFNETSNSGSNNRVYTLATEKQLGTYDTGYNRTHTCTVTAEDNVSTNTKEILQYFSGYSNSHDKVSFCYQGLLHSSSNWASSPDRHLSGNFPSTVGHDRGYTGTSLKKSEAISGDFSKFPGFTKNDWIISKGKYPRPKDSIKVHVESVTGEYLGEAIEATYLDKSKIRFTVHYSNGQTHTVYGNNTADIKFPYGVFVPNVGANTVYFKYTDNNLTGNDWPESGYGTFVVTTRERRPIDIVSVRYNGNDITENMSYNPNDIRVTIKYDNGAIVTYQGSSNNVGITTVKDCRGDLDGNGVVNSQDEATLTEFLQSSSKTLTADQRKQADINQDNKITTEDLTALKQIISRKIPFDHQTFYVRFANLNKVKELTLTSVRRKVTDIIISSAPDRTRYIEGEDFEPKGMVVTVRYNNNEYQTLHYKDNNTKIDGLVLGNDDYPVTDMIRNQDRIPVTYTENGSSAVAWQKIEVRKVILTSIVITQEPKVTNYASGESFDSRGMKVTAYYDEGFYTDGRQDNYSLKRDLNLSDVAISGGSKLMDSTGYVLVKADSIDKSNRETKGFIQISKLDITSPATNTLTVGTHTTIQYQKNGGTASLTGTVVGNNYVTVSYEEDNITKQAFQPIFVDKKKLTKVSVFQSPHKIAYIVGDIFNSNGLILRAYYTDGTSEYVYEQTADAPDGYYIKDGNQPLPKVSEVIAIYEKDGIKKTAKVPITVTDNSIESITAAYTGPSVDLGQKFLSNFVIVNVIYKNGSVDSFYANATDGGRNLVDIYRQGTEDPDTTIHDDSYDNVRKTTEGKYINTFTVKYAGLTADFEVTGVKNIPSLDFSTSVAQGRRDAADWTETFRAVKIKAVYDYVNEYTKNGDSGLSSVPGKQGVTVDGTEQISPMLWFEREGDWVQPETNFQIEYKTRTSGFLFPQTPLEEPLRYNLQSDAANLDYMQLPYLMHFEQKTNELHTEVNGFYHDTGWSDWMKNGDSGGTSNAKRIAYNYTLENPNSQTSVRTLDAAKFKITTLNGYQFKNDEDPQIKIYVNGDTSHPYIVRKNTEIEIQNIQSMKIELAGTVYVRNLKGVYEKKNFSDVYKVGYKIGTSNEPYNWKNEWVGTLGMTAECFEIKLQLATAPIDDYSFSVAPFIATQPEDASPVVGTKAIFTTKAVGQNLVYQWYKIAKEDAGDMSKAVAIPGATKYFYETPSVTMADDQTVYYCVVSNSAGSQTSVQAILYVVDTLPKITGNISDTQVEEGNSYTLTIAATCKNMSDLQYQWEMTDDTGNWKVVQPSSQNNAYTFTATKETHNKYIRCKVTNSRGYVYSNPARLSSIITPTVTITADKSFTNPGKVIRFTSYVTSYAGSPEYQWYVKNEDGGSYELQTNETDKTFEFKTNIPGSYRIKCIVKDGNGYSESLADINNEDDTNYVGVKIGKIPTITKMTYSVTKTGTVANDIATVNAYLGTFTVEVDANEFKGNTLNYEWYKNGRKLSGKTGKTLTLENLEENNQVIVMCKVSDSFGGSYKTVQFDVKEIGETTK